MGWRGLLRVVDFERLLTAQAALAESLEKSATREGASSEDARTMRLGFNLLAKVLFTRRASIPDVHDLVWLDHLVVARDARPARVWEGEHAREAWDRLASNRGRMGQIVPRSRHSSWADVPLGELPPGEPLRLERGVAGPFMAGLVTQDETLELMDELRPLSSRTKEGEAILRELRRLATAVRHEARESVALVFVASA